MGNRGGRAGARRANPVAAQGRNPRRARRISTGGGFQPEHSRFLLFPTRYHQQRECVIPPAQARFDELCRERPAAKTVRLEFIADLVETRRLESLAPIEALSGQHIWRNEVIADRFEWGKGKSIQALAVRVFRLAQGLEIPLDPAYGGCKSWIELERDAATEGAVPVLSDAAFAEKLERFRAAVQPAGA
jgi:hypothetical protein